MLDMRQFVLLFLLTAVATGCYNHNTPVKPCANIENCDNPADVPPPTDALKPDGGR
jgi:hypothetical protein